MEKPRRLRIRRETGAEDMYIDGHALIAEGRTGGGDGERGGRLPGRERRCIRAQTRCCNRIGRA